MNVENMKSNCKKSIERMHDSMEGIEINKSPKKMVQSALDECKLSNKVYDLKIDGGRIIIYLEGIMSKEDRQRLLAKLEETSGKSQSHYQVVAFYK